MNCGKPEAWKIMKNIIENNSTQVLNKNEDIIMGESHGYLLWKTWGVGEYGVGSSLA
jgi:hypothetical protein